MKKWIIALAFMGCTAQMMAQQVIDKVVAVVGDEAIMQSDIESQVLQMQQQNVSDIENPRCWIMDQLLQKKLMLSRAKSDSLVVSDEAVEGELDRRLQFFIEQFRGVENLEKFYNKSVLEIKDEFRSSVKEQLLMDQMQGRIIGSIDVSPEEVRKFYRNTPSDSLPYYNTEVEFGQIVIFPKISKEEREKARQKLEEIRQQILNGGSFRALAAIHSEDVGTALKGGHMEMQRASNYVPEFAAAALALKKDSVSGIVETKYGFHILQLLDRKGELVEVRHILIKPKLTSEEVLYAVQRLDSIRNAINNMDSVTFEAMAARYSEDQETRNRGGIVVDMKTNSSRIPVDELDATTFFTIDKLDIGEVSEPIKYMSLQDGKEGYRILYLKSKSKPHKANLQDDYPKLKQLAMEHKKVQKLEKWFDKYISKTYIHLAPEYRGCEELSRWEEGIGMSKR